jgi:hypothetical protein
MTTKQHQGPTPSEAPKSTLPAVYDYADDAGAGFDGANESDFIIPMLDILQQKSPEVEKETLDGAKAGSLIIRALGLVLPGRDEGVPFVPVGRQHKFVEWIPREQQGGIVAQHEPDDAIVREARARQAFGRLKLPNGNDLVETFYLFGLVAADEQTLRVCAPFTSTKIGLYRGMMTKAQGVLVKQANGQRVNPPLFAHRFRLKTVFTEKKGNTWWNYANIGFDGATAEHARLNPSGPLYQDARDFYQQLKRGEVKADTRTAMRGDDEVPSGSAAEAMSGADDEVPF